MLQNRLLKPFDHEQRVARYRYATSLEIQNAIEVAIEARQKWDRRLLAYVTVILRLDNSINYPLVVSMELPKPVKLFSERVDIFLHAADLCASKYRMRLNAATMLGQGKTIFQAEIGFYKFLLPLMQNIRFLLQDGQIRFIMILRIMMHASILNSSLLILLPNC